MRCNNRADADDDDDDWDEAEEIAKETRGEGDPEDYDDVPLDDPIDYRPDW